LQVSWQLCFRQICRPAFLFRSINLIKRFKLDGGKFAWDLLFAFQAFFQGLKVYTLYTTSKDTKIIIACTSISVGADMTTFINSNLPYEKLAIRVTYLHLGNVILATQLVSKQIRDLISSFENVTSSMRRKALPYSLIIAAIHFLASYYMTSASTTFPNIENLLGILVAPMIWPAIAFFVRIFALKIISYVVRYAINRF
jgi:hypothetical protein